MVVALADMAGLQKVASFTLNNLYKPGDTIHTTYVEDTANSGESTLVCIICIENSDSSGNTLFFALKQALGLSGHLGEPHVWCNSRLR